MSSKQKRRANKGNPGASRLDPARLRERALAALDRGATKSALSFAKELVKADAGPASEKLLADAYRARIDGLVAPASVGGGSEAAPAGLIRHTAAGD